jgi:excisionase family DNA binding protein
MTKTKMTGYESPIGYTRVPGAARYLGVGQRTIWELIRNGKISTYRLGKKIVLLKYSDIDAFMETIKETRKSQVDEIVDEILERFNRKKRNVSLRAKSGAKTEASG